MFRKYYKAANDDIKTNRELINKVFENSAGNETSEKKSRIYSFGMRYGTAFAAVLVLCGAAAFYPQIMKLNEPPVVVQEPNQIRVSDAEIKGAEKPGKIEMEEPKITQGKTEVADEAPAQVSQNAIAETEENNKKNNQSEDLSKARLFDSQPVTQYDFKIDISDIKSVSDTEIENAVSVLTEKLGKMDKATGNLYVFEIIGKFEKNEEIYYLGRWKWLVYDHTSLLSEFVLNSDLSKMYECINSDNTIRWNTEVNLFD